VRDHRDHFDVSLMCEALAVSHSGFYAWLGRAESPRSVENRRLVERIREEHADSRRIYGSPRIHAALKARGETCGRHRVARLMRQAGLRSKVVRRFVRTTDSRHHHPVAENLLNRCFTTTSPNAVWVSDITYLATDEGWLYLAATMDLFSRRIVGWSMSDRASAALVVDALQMAIDRRAPAAGLMHHSDRGVQYAAEVCQKLLARHAMLCSMSGKGDCYDNAVKESFFHTLKTEHVYHEHYGTRAEARASVFEYIEVFYNRQRLHSTLGYFSPSRFEDEQLSTACQSPPPEPPPRGGAAPAPPRYAPASQGLAPRGSPQTTTAPATQAAGA
jgi:transposase InsO family protein